MPTRSNIAYVLGVVAVIVAIASMLIRHFMYKQSRARGYKILRWWEYGAMVFAVLMIVVGEMLSQPD